MRSKNMFRIIIVCSALLVATRVFADAWDDVLSQAKLTKEQARFDNIDQKLFQMTEFVPPVFWPLHDAPLRIPLYVQLFREIILRQQARLPVDLTFSTLSKIGISIRRNVGGDPLTDAVKKSKKPGALTESIADVYRVTKKSFSASERAKIQTDISAIPKDIAEALAFLIFAEVDAYEWRQKSMLQVLQSPLFNFNERIEMSKMDGEDDLSGSTPGYRMLMKNLDLEWMMAGGFDLLEAIIRVQKSLEKATSTTSFSFEHMTPLGMISLQGARQNNTYQKNLPYLLIVDLDGSDTYYAGGGSYDATHPVSVIIDVKGQDRYLADWKERKTKYVHPLFGAGVFGYGILLDMEGDDVYRSNRHTQGHGTFGVGVLWDIKGNDKYECYTKCQASATFGAGVLIDESGADSYSGFQEVQAFSGTRGAALLVDQGTDSDTYLANDTEIDFPALVDKKHNTSLAQGCASGERADVSDGHSYSGGFAALVDGGGDNTFTAGFFAQGISYWYGVGVLSVGEGNDTFVAGKYAQGASAHFGVGILHNTGGDDSYRVEQELAQGHGHDYGVGFLFDEAGDDSYDAPNFSLGCSSSNGMGFFWDKSGDDTYSSKEKETLGCASWRSDELTFRLRDLSLGVFLDTGGKNRFNVENKKAKSVTTSGSWLNEPVAPEREKPKMFGVGRVANAPETQNPD